MENLPNSFKSIYLYNFVVTKFGMLGGTTSTSHLFFQNTTLRSFEDSMAQGHQQLLALHLVMSWLEVWQKLLPLLPEGNQLWLRHHSHIRSKTLDPRYLMELIKSLQMCWIKNLLLANKSMWDGWTPNPHQPRFPTHQFWSWWLFEQRFLFGILKRITFLTCWSWILWHYHHASYGDSGY